MKVEKVPIQKIDILSPIIQDYISENPALNHLFDYKPKIENFKQVIEDKRQQNINRKLLVSELKKQYHNISNKEIILEQIEHLSSSNTFTVTTAHQLCLFTGPLYFIYKAISVIKLAQLLSEEYPQYHFVPIFWLGSEDHDFEEINHLHINNTKIEWSSGQNGAVGMMKNTGLKKTIDELSKHIFSANKNNFIKYLEKTFSSENVYVNSFIKLIHNLFRSFGLVILEQNNRAFKQAFSATIESELIHNIVKNNIQKEVDYIDENYKLQANPRNINLFYMKHGLRERIVQKEDLFFVNNTTLVFTQKELLSELNQYPERFSPNVVLRPLYQEFVLPNIAYVGGGGELAYWLELKGLFASQGRKMPMLLLRDMACIIDDKTTKKIKNIGLDRFCLFKNKDVLFSELVKKNSTNRLNLTEEKKNVKEWFDSIAITSANIDKSLLEHVYAQSQKVENIIDKIEVKMLRAEKKKFDILIQQITAVHKQLFPQNILQERYQNFIPYYLKYDQEFFNILLKEFNPMSNEMKLIFE